MIDPEEVLTEQMESYYEEWDFDDASAVEYDIDYTVQD